jgi:hypothetical protein
LLRVECQSAKSQYHLSQLLIFIALVAVLLWLIRLFGHEIPFFVPSIIGFGLSRWTGNRGYIGGVLGGVAGMWLLSMNMLYYYEYDDFDKFAALLTVTAGFGLVTGLAVSSFLDFVFWLWKNVNKAMK